MKKIIPFLLFFLSGIRIVNAQCNCTALPAPPAAQAVTITPAMGVTGIQNAINSATGPKTIYLASGTYSVGTTYINVTKPGITIRSVTGNQNDVIIQGTGMLSLSGTYHGISILHRKCTIADLTVRDIDTHPIEINFWYQPGSIDSVLIHNVHIIDGGEQLIKMSYSGLTTQSGDNGIIECSTIEYSTSLPGSNYYTNGIDLHYAKNWIIRDNVIRNIKHGPSTTSDAGPAILFFKQGVNPLIERNKIINCDEGISLGNWGDSPNISCYGGTLRNNMILGHANSRCGLLAVLCPSANIINNTVYSPGGVAFTAQKYSIEITGSLTANCLIQNNLCDEPWYNNSNLAPTPSLTTNNFSATTSYFTSTLSTSPNSLRLSPTAPAPSINAGTSTSLRVTDFECQSMSGNYDIGADEIVTSTDLEESGKLSGVKFYPNPFTNEITIKLDFDGEVEIEVTDVLGRTQLVKQISASKNGDYKINMEACNLNNGLYFITIKSGNRAFTEKLIKQ
jgi:hypothetical protein